MSEKKFAIGDRVTFRYIEETLTGIVQAVQSDPDMCNVMVGGEMYYEEFEDLELATQPPATETDAGEGDVHTVMCRCGFMASQHWADGSCPGDGYLYDDAPENHMNEPELSYGKFMDILRKELHFPPDDGFGEWAVIEAIRQDRAIIMTNEGEIARIQTELASARAQLAACQGALEMSTRALVRCQPQVKGVLVMQDVQWAIDAGHKALAAGQPADGASATESPIGFTPGNRVQLAHSKIHGTVDTVVSHDLIWVVCDGVFMPLQYSSSDLMLLETPADGEA